MYSVHSDALTGLKWLHTQVGWLKQVRARGILMTRILVAEDETQVRQLIATTLRDQGYQVVEAADGEAAYEAVAEAAVAEKPDLVVLDLMLPKLNGFEVLEKLKANKSTAYIPVVIVTARNQAQDETRGMKAGACDYITKPWSPGELEDRVRIALDQRRASRPHRFTSADRLTDSRQV